MAVMLLFQSFPAAKMHPRRMDFITINAGDVPAALNLHQCLVGFPLHPSAAPFPSQAAPLAFPDFSSIPALVYSAEWPCGNWQVLTKHNQPRIVM